MAGEWISGTAITSTTIASSFLSSIRTERRFLS